MISGEFDLSVGQNFAFVPDRLGDPVRHQRHERVAGARHRARPSAPWSGSSTAYVTTIFRIPSFITTLGMFFVLQGMNNLLISGHQLIMFDPSLAMSLLGARIGSTPFYMPLIWMFVIARSSGSSSPARLRQLDLCDRRQGRPGQGDGRADGAGEAHQLRASARFSPVSPAACSSPTCAASRRRRAQNYELLAITAAVLGGTSLFGGTGTIWGSVIGAVPARVDPDRPGPDRRARIVLRDLHRRDAGRRRHRQHPRSAAGGRQPDERDAAPRASAGCRSDTRSTAPASRSSSCVGSRTATAATRSSSTSTCRSGRAKSSGSSATTAQENRRC